MHECGSFRLKIGVAFRWRLMKTHPTSVARTGKMKGDEERKREYFLLSLELEKQNPKTKT